MLLVEDNELNQQVATELLKSVGATVTIANHGGESVKFLTAPDGPARFDIVFMDLQMPEVDGLTATKLIRADSRLQTIPIIAMTAHALVEERQRCLDAGMNDHVSKPIDPDALFTVLRRWTKPREVSEPVPEKQVSKENGVVIPEIAGINSADGLKRVVGNKKLFLDLLAQFAEKQDNAKAQIYEALQSNDPKLAERIAHTVKGVAGNIGITEVQLAAATLEKAIREKDPAVSASLEEFGSLLARQVNAIREALHAASPAKQDDAEETPFTPESASAAVARLKSLLEANDGDAGEAFVSLQNVIGARVDQSLMKGLAAAIGEFEFDKATAELDQIAQQLSFNGGQARS